MGYNLATGIIDNSGTNNKVEIDVRDCNTVMIAVSGTWVGNLSCWGLVDPDNEDSIVGIAPFSQDSSSLGQLSPITFSGSFIANVSGISKFRIDGGPLDSGTANIYIGTGTDTSVIYGISSNLNTNSRQQWIRDDGVDQNYVNLFEDTNNPANTIPLPVSIQGSLGVDLGDVTIINAVGAAAVNVQDGGNSITVDDGSGSLTVDNGGTFAVQSAQSGTWTVQPGNTANTTAWKVDGSAVTQPVSGTFWQATQPVSGTFFQTTQPVSLAAGATTIAKAEDVASIDADVGVPSMAVRKATPANTSGADGDYEFLQMSAGRLWTSSTVDAALPAGTNAIGKLAANSGVTIGAIEIAATQTLATVTTVSTVTNLSQMAGTAISMNNGTVDAGTQRVTLASNSTGVVGLATGSNTIGALTANQSVNVAQMNGTTVTMGNGASGTGVQRVTLANDSTGVVSLATGANTIGALTANQSVNVAQMNGVTVTMGNGASGTGVQRVTIASDSTGTVNGPTLTKGTQGSTGFSVQDLRDAGRTELRYYAVAAAAGTTTTETAISLTKSSGTAATSAANSFVITNGKRFRITNITFATRGHSTATVQTTTFNFRINTAGAVTTSSTPIALAVRSATPATASTWDRAFIDCGEGWEIVGDGTLQFGVTAAATYTTNAPTWDVTIIGYEY